MVVVEVRGGGMVVAVAAAAVGEVDVDGGRRGGKGAERRGVRSGGRVSVGGG